MAKPNPVLRSVAVRRAIRRAESAAFARGAESIEVDAVGAIDAAYKRGRVDGAAKQERNYETGYQIGVKIGQEQGYAECYKAIKDRRQREDNYDHVVALRRGPWSMWERICRGKTH